MEKKTITILGNVLSVTFNMATQLKYEEIAKKPFDISKMDSQTDTMNLCYAALLVANEHVPFTFDEMIDGLKMRETAELKDAVIGLALEWFEIPEVMKSAEEEDEEDGEKN